MPNVVLIVVLVFLVIGVAAFVFAFLGEKKRREGMERAARDMGLEYRQEDRALPGRIGSLPLLTTGRRGHAGNVMSGTIEDLELLLFDYRYTTGSGKNRSTHRQTVAAFRLDGAVLPEFKLRAERFYHKIAGVFGWKDIDFDEHPEFSKQYALSGTDEASVRAMFTPDVITFLESVPRLSAEGHGAWLIVFRPGRRVTAERIHEFLDESFTVCNRLTRAFAETQA
ncbi:MAG: hypothetical protein GY715_21450 [Planctomycetes bacterium]|nr:hypothetical protein [Planctomycetota bacterium]